MFQLVIRIAWASKIDHCDKMVAFFHCSILLVRITGWGSSIECEHGVEQVFARFGVAKWLA
jgi:hypothetical protein